MAAPLTRRRFMAKMGQTAGVASGLSLCTLCATSAADQVPDYSGYEDILRDKIQWDTKTRGTHLINCTGACPFFVYSKDGIILREEQSRDMPRLKGVPEYNPRGCQKGVCGTDYVYGPQRVKYPMIRVGARGEGKWRRVSWDEALTYIAEKLVSLTQEHGPDCTGLYTPVPAVSPVSFSAGHRFAHLWGAYTYTFFDWYADLPIGEPITLGVQADVAETADWYNARMILLWGANAAQTRIPDAHFLNEARYNGSRVVCIAPEYNATAIHSDLWVHPKPGTDTALALGMANVILRDRLYQKRFLQEQTDMSLLVRMDTKQFLRQSDLGEGGNDARFYCYDLKAGKAVPVKGSWADEPETPAPLQPLFLARNTLTFAEGTLDLGELDPALEGSYTTTLPDGKKVELKPVFQLLKEELEANYTPQQVSEITGVNPQVIERLAKDYATIQPAMIISGGGISHWYHAEQHQRALLMLCALTGNLGKNGSGYNHYIGQWKITPLLGMAKLAFPQSPKKHRFVNTTLWTYLHAGFGKGDNPRIRQTGKYVEQSLERKWTPMYPREGRDPKAMFVYRGNWLNQAKGQVNVLENLWPKLDLIVTLNFRMDSQALYSDVVLPSAHWYEKLDLNCTGEHSFIQATFPAIEPLHESKTDWQIFRLLAEKVQEVCIKRGFTEYHDEQFDWHRDYSTFSDQFTKGGRFDSDAACAQFILDTAPQTKGITLEQLRTDGPQRFRGNWTSPQTDEPYTPFQHFVQGKKPWPTLVGRMQFYIDHEWFLELNKALPVYHPPLEDEKQPLRFNTLHGRHAIHSTWKDNESLLRLNRGGPFVMLSPPDAAERDIRDNDWVEVFNEVGTVICRAKIYPSGMPGHVSMPFSPELYMDLGAGSSQCPLPVQINPTEICGDYGQLQFKPNYYGPMGTQRDVRVDVRKHVG
jgi:complex iron-sulfur molybdoenzyme family reductase subunit alpha